MPVQSKIQIQNPLRVLAESGIILGVMPAFPPLFTILPARWNDLITRFDTAGFKLINSGLVSPAMDRVMVAATVLGGGTHQAVFCLLLIAGIARRQVNWRRAGYAGLAAAAMSTATVQICKHIWDRPRPLLAMFDVRVLEKPLFVHSFPSGHTMTAFAVAFACSAFVPRLRWVLIPFACLTGISRVYVGAHFPIDVMFGALVGAFLGLAGAAIVRHWNEVKEAGRGLMLLMRRYGAYILLVAMCAGIFFWGLGRTPFIGFDEGVYSECSREMLASGDYVVPRVGGDYFFDKPPLCYWLQAGSMRVLGVNPLGARLPVGDRRPADGRLDGVSGRQALRRKGGAVRRVRAGFIDTLCRPHAHGDYGPGVFVYNQPGPGRVPADLFETDPPVGICRVLGSDGGGEPDQRPGRGGAGADNRWGVS